MIRDTSAQDAAIDPAPARQRRRRFVIGGLAVVALGVAVQGQVVAAVSPTLYAPTTGTVTTQVNAGDKVTKGQPLAVVDSPELLSEFERERSTLLSLQAAHGRQRGVVANFERRVEELTVRSPVDGIVGSLAWPCSSALPWRRTSRCSPWSTCRYSKSSWPCRRAAPTTSPSRCRPRSPTARRATPGS